jgi:hypothetical protein
MAPALMLLAGRWAAITFLTMSVSVTIPAISPALSTRSEPIRCSAIVCDAIAVRVVRRLSTVLGRHGLVDFKEGMIIKELKEVDRA